MHVLTRELKQGVLQNGKMIAVKKFNSSIPGAKDRQFDNEANHLMRLKHRNVVQLIAWCSETENIYMWSTTENTSALRSQQGCFAWSTCLKETFVGIFQV